MRTALVLVLLLLFALATPLLAADLQQGGTPDPPATPEDTPYPPPPTFDPPYPGPPTGTPTITCTPTATWIVRLGLPLIFKGIQHDPNATPTPTSIKPPLYLPALLKGLSLR